MILLFLSVVLVTGTMGLYTLLITTSAMKTEHLVIRGARIWADSSGSQVALHVENIGGRDALITAIEVGFVEESWDSVFYAEGRNITGAFNHTISGVEYSYEPVTGSIMIPVSGSVLIYMDNSETVDIQDLGMVVEIIVYTSTLPYMTMDDVETT